MAYVKYRGHDQNLAFEDSKNWNQARESQWILANVMVETLLSYYILTTWSGHFSQI